MSWSNDTLALIGNTPLVKLRSFDTGCCTLLVKLESQNPGGSIKDRIGLAMIAAGERAGKITKDSVLVEATAGNTGLGLALVAASKGYRLILVIPDKMSREKILHLKALGAEVVITRSDVPKGHPDYYQDLAERIALEEPNGYYINQFSNPANPLAHVETTGPEIWRQTDGKVDAVVCGVGSAGTITGLSRYFAGIAPNVEMVLADPVGSILRHYVENGALDPDADPAASWLVEGIGEDFIPPIADFSRVRRAFSITDKESIDTAKLLLRREGILAGSSTGTLVAAALRYCQEQTSPKLVVTFVCDTGNKYLSKQFDENWITEQGLGSDQRYGDIRDLIARHSSRGGVVSLLPTDSLGVAYGRMKLFNLSRIPVLSAAKVVGIVDEEDLLLAVQRDKRSFDIAVNEIMTSSLTTIGCDGSLDEVIAILRRGLVAIVQDSAGFHGLITRIDVLKHLRTVSLCSAASLNSTQ